MNRKYYRWFFAAIVAVSALFFLILFFFLRKPLLTDIHPRQALPGTIVVVEGFSFGRQGPRSILRVGNQQITLSHIMLWKPNRITFRMPDNMRSGDLIVTRNQQESNRILLTNINTIPRPRIDNPPLDLSARLADNLYESYWELAGINQEYFDFYLDGEPIPSAQLFPIQENRLGLYLPAFQLSPIDGAPSQATLLSRLEYRPRDYTLNETFILRNGDNTVLYDDSSGTVLYHLQISFDSPPRSNSGELLLRLPLPAVAERGIHIETSFPGWVQLLPFTDDHALLRLFPHGRIRGSVTLRVHGRAPETSLPGLATLQLATDDYDPSAPTAGQSPSTPTTALLPLYADYVIPAEKPVLDAEQRRVLSAAVSGVEAALPLAREMYSWFSEGIIPSRIEAFVDELRRRGIAARKRIGYLVLDDGARFNTTAWAEIFLPRWGWVALYEESMLMGLPFAEARHTYLPLPLDTPFPLLYDRHNAETQILIHSRVTPDA